MTQGWIALSLALCLFFVGCKHNPPISPCINDAIQGEFECSDGKKNWTVDWDFADNYVCFTPSDMRTIYANCRRGPVKIMVCVVDAFDKMLDCSDWQDNRQAIPLHYADKFVCMSSDDARAMFEYCAKK